MSAIDKIRAALEGCIRILSELPDDRTCISLPCAREALDALAEIEVNESRLRVPPDVEAHARLVSKVGIAILAEGDRIGRRPNIMDAHYFANAAVNALADRSTEAEPPAP